MPRADVALLPTCLPASCLSQELRRRQIGLLKDGPKVLAGEEPRLILEPQEGEYFVFLSEQTNSLEMGRRHRRAGSARFFLSKVFRSLLLSPSKFGES